MWCNGLYPRGVLSGKVGTGMCGPDSAFSVCQVYQLWPPFKLKIGLDILDGNTKAIPYLKLKSTKELVPD